LFINVYLLLNDKHGEVVMTSGSTRLARAVKIYVSMGWWFCAIGLVVVPGVLVLILGGLSNPDSRAPDMPVLARVYIDEAVLAPPEGLAVVEPSTLVVGQGEMRIRTRSKAAWTLLFLLIEIVLAVLLYVYGQLRALIRSVIDRQPFQPENASRIRRLGVVVIAWGAITPLLKLFVGAAMVDEVAVRGLILKPPIDFQFEAVFFGLAILVLSEIFRQASELQNEQSLTI
jgi:hypothetical protein